MSELLQVRALAVALTVDLVGVETSGGRVEFQHRLAQETQMGVQRLRPDAPSRPAHSRVITQPNIQFSGAALM
jgi:hypothetical protein